MTYQRIARPAAAVDVDPHDVRLFPRPPAWTEDAACAGQDPELFFADSDITLNRAAKRVCAICPVRLRCLSEAIERNEQWGIYGGHNFTSGENRTKARRGLKQGVA